VPAANVTTQDATVSGAGLGSMMKVVRVSAVVGCFVPDCASSVACSIG
jgi:hypothetical protein